MPTSVRLLISAPSSPEAMKLWMASMSLVTRLIRSPVCFWSWIGERKPLDVGVERPAQIVHHPLADAGGDVFLRVGADRADGGDCQHGEGGELQNRELVRAGGGEDQLVQPSVRGLRLQHVVEDHFQRPRLRQVRGAFHEYGHDAYYQARGVRSQQMPEGEPRTPRISSHGVRAASGRWSLRHLDHLPAKVLH